MCIKKKTILVKRSGLPLKRSADRIPEEDSKPFGNRAFYHLNTRLVWYSDHHWSLYNCSKLIEFVSEPVMSTSSVKQPANPLAQLANPSA